MIPTKSLPESVRGNLKKPKIKSPLGLIMTREQSKGGETEMVVSWEAFPTGKAVLFVNTASKCGYTPQYQGLQKLHETYGDKGLIIAGYFVWRVVFSDQETKT